MLAKPRAMASYAKTFAAGLLDPLRSEPANIRGSNGATAAKRYNIYRNNVTSSLVDALAAIYPAIQRITGVEFFRAMARFHVRETPPVSPLLFEYGYDFPDFIARYEYAAQMPWLTDTARIERAWLDAYHAEDAPVPGAEMFANVAPERLGSLTFIAHPAARIVPSQYPAVSIFAMNRGEGPVGPIETVEPQDALITRPGFDVTVRHLPPGGAVFLSSLFAGETLEIAAAAAIASTPLFDLSMNISGMIDAGVFTSLGERQ
jgi:hypothetical protein